MQVAIVTQDHHLVEAVTACLSSDDNWCIRSFRDFQLRGDPHEELGIVDARDIPEVALVSLVQRYCARDSALLVVVSRADLIKPLTHAGLECRGLLDVLPYSEVPTIALKLRVYRRLLDHRNQAKDAKQVELYQQEREKILQELADCMPLAIWRATPDGTGDYYNKPWYEFTGQIPEDTRQQRWPEAIHPEDAPRIQEAWQQSVAQGKAYKMEFRMREGATGKYFWHLVHALPVVDEHGVITKWYGSCTNIDQLKRAMQEVERLCEQLEGANRLKDEFLATLSHELRTPLNVIIGHTGLLLENKLAEEEKHVSLLAIERNASALLRLVEDLLDVSKIITGKLSIHMMPTQMEETIRGVVASLSASWRAKDQQIEVDCEGTMPPLDVDQDRMRQVIWNLLTNAIKFTPTGGRIFIRFRRDKDDAVIEVQDSGVGIAPDFLPRIFERFSQQDSSAARKFGGLGLGLAIVRHIIELHGGTVSAHSSGFGRGATFTVRLPLPQPNLFEMPAE